MEILAQITFFICKLSSDILLTLKEKHLTL